MLDEFSPRGDDPHVLTQAIEYPVITLCINIGYRFPIVLTEAIDFPLY